MSRGRRAPLGDAHRQTVGLDVLSTLLNLAAEAPLSERFRAMPMGASDEAELRRALCDAGLLGGSGLCRAVKSVSIEPTGASPMLRIDLVVMSPSRSAADLGEMPRGRHVLLAQRGIQAQRLARSLRRALGEARRARDLDASPADEVGRLERVELRLVPGGRVPALQPLWLLSEPDGASAGAEPTLHIDTWDPFSATG